MVEIIEVEINADRAIKDISESQKRIEALKKELEKLNEATKEETEAKIKLRAEIKAETQERTKNERILTNSIKTRKSESESIDQLRAALSVVSARWAALSKEERENTEAGQALSAQKLELTERLKGFEKQTGDTRRNVGNYTESILQAAEASGNFGNAAGGAVGGVQALLQSFKLIIANPVGLIIAAITTALTALFSAFRRTQEGSDKLNKGLAIVSATFDTIVGLVGQLALDIVKVFEDPKKAVEDFGQLIQDFAINKLNKLLEVGGFIGKAFQQLFEGKFSAAFDTAGKAVGTFVEEFLPIGTIKKGVDALGKAVDDIADKAAKATKEALGLVAAEKAFQELQIATAKSVAELNGELEKNKQITASDNKTFAEKIKAGELAIKQTEQLFDIQIKLAQAEQAIADARVRQAKQTGLVNRELVLAQQEAAARTIEIQKQRDLALLDANEQLRLAQLDEFDLQLDAFIDYNDTIKTGLEKRSADERFTFEERRGFIQKARELTEQAIAAETEELIKQGATREQLNAIFQEENAVTLAARLKELGVVQRVGIRALEIFRERQLAASDFAEAELALERDKTEQINEIQLQQITKEAELQQASIFQKLDAQRAELAESERLETEAAIRVGLATTSIADRYSKARKEIDKAEFNAKLELAAGFAGNLAQIAGEQTAIGKAAAVAQTAISTYKSATESYASLAGIPVVGPALGFAAAGAAVAAGLANVKRILAVKSGLPGDSSKGASGITGGAAAASVTPQVNQGIVSRQVGTPQTPTPPVAILPVDAVTAEQRTSINIKTAGGV